METAIGWAQVMTKTLSCAIWRLYMRMLNVDVVKKKYIFYISSWSQTYQHSQKRSFCNTTKIVIVPLPTKKKLLQEKFNKLRIGSHKLRVETGRQYKSPVKKEHAHVTETKLKTFSC